MLNYGYRSKCCYAPIKIAQKKTKAGHKVAIWVCLRCKRRDVDLVEYTGIAGSESSQKKNSGSKFAFDEE